MKTARVIGVKSKVLEILAGNPSLPYSRIADEVGVTRERVRQIARRNGYPFRYGISKLKICPVCGVTFHTRNLYCSPGCVYKARQRKISLNCHQCGKTIERTPGNMRSKTGKYFCDRLCHRNWMVKSRSSVHEVHEKKKYSAGGFYYEVGLKCEIVHATHVPAP